MYIPAASPFLRTPQIKLRRNFYYCLTIGTKQAPQHHEKLPEHLRREGFFILPLGRTLRSKVVGLLTLPVYASHLFQSGGVAACGGGRFLLPPHWGPGGPNSLPHNAPANAWCSSACFNSSRAARLRRARASKRWVSSASFSIFSTKLCVSETEVTGNRSRPSASPVKC